MASSVSKSEALPIGAGFLGWILDEQYEHLVHEYPSQAHKLSNEFLQAALDVHVRAIWFSFGNDLKRWIDLVREHDFKARNVGAKRTLIFVQVNSVEEARIAVTEWGVDVLSVQGDILLPFHSSHTASTRSSMRPLPCFPSDSDTLVS